MAARPRVLLVDDDAENCRALTELLAAGGFQPLTFHSGEAALSAITSGAVRPQAVVTDVRMPGLDGVALLRRIRTLFPTMPVILISAFADEDLWVEGLRAGALDVFPKPIQGASLVRTLSKAMNADRV